jgi:hypothetical protein
VNEAAPASPAANLRAAAGELRHPRLATPRPGHPAAGSARFNLGVTQELFNRITLTGEWYHNRFFDITQSATTLRGISTTTRGSM